MSTGAIIWAFAQKLERSTSKFVLLIMADTASHDGKSFPRVKTISEMTSLHEDTVRKAIEDLIENGYITDTGKRTGTTGQVKIYQFPQEACRDEIQQPKTPRNRGLKDPNGSGVEGVKTRARPEQDPEKPDSCHNRGNEEQGREAAAPKIGMRKFTDAWLEQYEDFFGYSYGGFKSQPSKEGVAADKLLKMSNHDEILKVASMAWHQKDDRRFWACVSKSKNLPDLCSNWDRIRSELAQTNQPRQKYTGPNLGQYAE